MKHPVCQAGETEIGESMVGVPVGRGDASKQKVADPRNLWEVVGATWWGLEYGADRPSAGRQ